MMSQMIQCVAKNDMSRIIRDHLAAGTEPPVGFQQIVIAGLGERLARLRHMLVECLDKLIGGRLLILTLSLGRREIKFILVDDQRHPRWLGCYQSSKAP